MYNFRLQNLKFKHKIDGIANNFFYLLEIFASKEDIKRKCNPIMDLLNFTFNKKIVSEVVTLAYNQICGQTLSLKKKKKPSLYGTIYPRIRHLL